MAINSLINYFRADNGVVCGYFGGFIDFNRCSDSIIKKKICDI